MRSGWRWPPDNCEFVLGPTTSTTISPGRCAELKVTKVVTGTAPPGTTFPVVVDCQEPSGGQAQSSGGLPPGNEPPFTQTLTFPEGGGMQSIFIGVLRRRARGVLTVCTITETPPPGCTLVSINPSTVTVDGRDPSLQIVFEVTVTNNCEVAAAPAAAVPAAPTFTG